MRDAMFDRYTESVLTNIGINIIMTLSMYFPMAVGQLSIAQVGFMAIGAHLATVLTLHLHTPFGLAVLAAALVPWGLGLLFASLIIRCKASRSPLLRLPSWRSCRSSSSI